MTVFCKVFLIITLGLFLISSGAGCAGDSGSSAVKEGVKLEGKDVGGMTRSELGKYVAEQAKAYDGNSDEGAIDPKTWEVMPGTTGLVVDAEGTVNDVMMAAKGANVSFKMKTGDYTFISHTTSSSIVRIASFTTQLIDDRESRVNNIDLAGKAITYTILQPGEEFSFNKIVGRRTEAKGYEEAPMIIRTEDGPRKGMGVGGGICQLSTTIYNAAETCRLEITERHLHSKTVPYVAKGDDATISYGTLDLKFKNNREFPIMIKIYSTLHSVTADILENRSGK